MNQMNRRTFLKLTGTGSAAAVAAVVPGAGLLEVASANRLSFRATAGLPARPLPAYATKVLEGSVDLEHGTGIVTSRVLAGHPGANSEIALPGLSRVLRVTSATRRGSEWHLAGLVEDRSQLRPGENPQVEIVIDRNRGIVRAPLAGQEVMLRLE